MTDLQNAGIPRESVQLLGGGATTTSAPEESLGTLRTLDLPNQDLQLLSDGLKSGGSLIIVRTDRAMSARAEEVFASHQAEKVGERRAQPQALAATAAVGTGSVTGTGNTSRTGSPTDSTVIPVVEEELLVGKREVQRGGVRVYTRVVETPVQEQVVLREEHARVERHPVDRPISEAEVDALRDQSIEVRETAEEPVVAKTARVVEEVRIGKEASERTEHVTDTVRRTEVEVDQIPGQETTTTESTRGKNRQ